MMILKKQIICGISLLILCLVWSCSSGNTTYEPFWLNCENNSQGNNVSGIIQEGVPKTFYNMQFRRQKEEYQYIWMGFKENSNYTTDPISISSFSVDDANLYSIDITWDVPGTANIPSGNYTLYIAMGYKENDEYIERIRATAPGPCTEFQGGGGGSSTVQAHLEYLSGTPINYRIEEHNLFQLPLRTKLTGLDAGEEYWVRVYLEVLMPGLAEPLQSNYYTYLEFSNDFWEEMTLEFGGGDYAWDGDMEIRARVKLYDDWPGGNEADPNVNLIYPYLNKVLAPPTTPSLEQINVEYDQQVGENLFDEIMHVSGTTGTNDYIDAAYAPALKKVVFHKDLQHQAIPKGTIDLRDLDLVRIYIQTHHSNNAYRYLCSVDKIIDEQNEVIAALYVEIIDPNTNEVLAKGTFVDYSYHMTELEEPYSGANSEYYRQYVLTGSVIHELGHALGIPDEGHNQHTAENIFCVMYQGIVPNIDPMVINKKRSLYPNMHFCTEHINEIKY